MERMMVDCGSSEMTAEVQTGGPLYFCRRLIILLNNVYCGLPLRTCGGNR